ncbi:hypothetical protein ACTWPF_06910 [Oceanobacillus sp. M65]|uniref:hypothetical protein n=1 Tax=Oceanobacillus sp. M65 TaxID=3457435 RepID=UPI003FCD8F1C
MESIKVDLQDGKMDVTVKSVKIAIEDITKVIEEQAFVDITPEKKRIKQSQICYRLEQIKQAKQIFKRKIIGQKSIIGKQLRWPL